MKKFKAPSKTKLKKKLGIKHNDFKVIVADKAPAPEPGNVIERVAEWPKAATAYLIRRGLPSVVAAVVLVPIVIHEAKERVAAYREAAELVHDWFTPFHNLPHSTHYTGLSPTVAITANTATQVMTTFSLSVGTSTFTP